MQDHRLLLISIIFFSSSFRIRVSKNDDPRYLQKPLFGNNMVADKTGTIHVGDDVTVLS